eukprot:2231851-Rhodomonas_salina.5
MRESGPTPRMVLPRSYAMCGTEAAYGLLPVVFSDTCLTSAEVSAHAIPTVCSHASLHSDSPSHPGFARAAK